MSNRIAGLSTALLAIALLSCNPVSSSAPSVRRAHQEIIGGVTEPAHWYVVKLGNSQSDFCSGTLISKRTVITAGHCWSTGPDAITEVTFETGTPLSGVVLGVTSSVRHPGYDDISLTNDLALVNLSSDAPVQPVPLLRETMNATFIGPRFSWVGYGDINANGVGFGTRRVVTYPIKLIGPVGNIFVPATAPSGASSSIDATQFYFQLFNKNTCTGDSGGPGFVVRNGVERHAGVTSFGDDSCAYDGVQARTDATTMGWIQQTIDSFEGSNPCKADGVCGAGCATTTPTPRGTLGDPDCADAHCGADGICVLSCSPVDPDCAGLSINNCSDNGICQQGCSPADVDCAAGANKAVGAVCASGPECASGSCADGFCCNTLCSDGCQTCAAAKGATADGTCTLKSAGVTCRAAAGDCDVAETCSGTAPACPVDDVKPTATLCRPAAATCDVAELCDGASGECPANAFLANGTACGTGQCLAGACSGGAGGGVGGGAGGGAGGGGMNPNPNGCGCGAGEGGALALSLLVALRRFRVRRSPSSPRAG